MFPIEIVAFASSLLICVLIIGTKRFHMAQSARSLDTGAVQAMHRTPTPRIGGVAWFGALLISMAVAGSATAAPLWPFLLSTLPIFCAGLLEDLTRMVSSKLRYMAAILSSGLAIVLMGVWIDRMDAPLLGYAVGFAPIGVMLTLFVTASYSHAFNLVDGLNGLASGIAVIGGIAMSVIAAKSGATDLAWLLGLSVAALMGFMALNFPSGKIFLGDAGAYSIGHLMAWSALGVYALSPSLTCWALLLVFFWPFADTLFAVFRRVHAGKTIDTADRMHFHHLVMRGIEIKWLGRDKRHRANPLATLIILPIAAVPPCLGVVFMDRPLAAFLALLACGAGYVLLYNQALALACSRKPLALARLHLRGRARRLRETARG